MKTLKVLAFAAAAIFAVSCSSTSKMAKQAAGIQVSCSDPVLEVVAGEINSSVTIEFPAKFFHPKAVLEVTPVIVYEGGEAKMSPIVYQGEKVKDNYKVVSAEGATVTEKVNFDYAQGMEKCYLELRGRVKYKASSVATPAIKVAEGANTTYMLVNKDGAVSLKADGYQPIIKQTAEGQILYTINSSEVRGSQLSSKSVKDFRAALAEIEADGRKTITGTEIVAYASPDGGEKLNSKLSDKRSASAGKVWKKVAGQTDASDPELKSIGQDWEGFRGLVEKSDIEDKDLILRVLSMYSDPAMRENEIKNMSEIYQSLKGDVLPELRRARFIANVDYKNYTNEEILVLIENNIDVLDEPCLLHAATLVSDKAQKLSIYKKAVETFNSDAARFNIAVTELNDGNLKAAKKAFAAVTVKDADWYNFSGVLALREGKLAEAQKAFEAAGTDDAIANLGVIDILNGNYAKAAKELAGVKGCCHNTALAYILNGNLDKAAATAKCACPEVAYLRAIIAARKGDAAAAKKALEEASKNSDLAARSVKDVEFAAIR